jgi:hypothetical protein
MMTAQEERMLNIRRASLMVALLIPATGAAQTVTTVEQESPAPTGSAQPQLSVTRDGRVVLSWLEAAPQNSRRHKDGSPLKRQQHSHLHTGPRDEREREHGFLRAPSPLFDGSRQWRSEEGFPNRRIS